MNNVSQLIELVNVWYECQKERPTTSIEDFCRRHLSKQTMPPIEKAMSTGRPVALVNKIGTLFGRLTRFATIYSKKALSPVDLYNTVDFSYLKMLEEQGELTKTDLINLVVTDFTSGIEVIKRLIKNEYAEEYPDPKDKRSKRIRITEKGKQTLQLGRTQMRQLSDLFFDRLSDEEIQQLFVLLDKLNERHTVLYKDYKNEGFSEIITDFQQRRQAFAQ